jgi:hypothetical protein
MSATVAFVTSFAIVTLPRWADRAGQWLQHAVARMRQLRPSDTTSPARRAHTTLATRWALIAWTAAGVFAVAIGVSAFVFLTPAPAAPAPAYGTVTVDALPWATVVSIVGQNGTNHPLPEQASTPLSLRLPIGAYRITLSGPPPESVTRESTVTITEGQEALVDGGRFATLTAESYFAPYLAGGSDRPDASGSAPVETVSARAPEVSR